MDVNFKFDSSFVPNVSKTESNMRHIFVFFFVFVLGVSLAHERGCRYVLGKCVEECPEGTHAYSTACRSPSWSERTCDKPERVDLGAICDLSRCECDEPTVKDKTTGKCVKLEDCPKTDTE